MDFLNIFFPEKKPFVLGRFIYLFIYLFFPPVRSGPVWFGKVRFGLFARTLRTKRLVLVFFCVVVVVHHRVAVFLVFVFLGFVVAVAEISNFVAAHLNTHLRFWQ